MSADEHLRLLARLLLRAARTTTTSEQRLERTRERLQRQKFAEYLSEKRLASSWALLQRGRNRL